MDGVSWMVIVLAGISPVWAMRCVGSQAEIDIQGDKREVSVRDRVAEMMEGDQTEVVWSPGVSPVWVMPFLGLKAEIEIQRDELEGPGR